MRKTEANGYTAEANMAYSSTERLVVLLSVLHAEHVADDRLTIELVVEMEESKISPTAAIYTRTAACRHRTKLQWDSACMRAHPPLREHQRGGVDAQSIHRVHVLYKQRCRDHGRWPEVR
jgi:hypothetical protein